MNAQRYKELMDNNNAKLTPEEIKEGYHFCGEWDGLLVDWHDHEGEGQFCNTCCGSGMSEEDYKQKQKDVDLYKKNNDPDYLEEE